MNEFLIIKKYLTKLSKNNLAALNLQDDIYFNKEKKLGISVDTYVEGVHFLNSSNPDRFLKKIVRSSLSDIYCKGLIPESYFLSLALNKNCAKKDWLNKFKNILNSEQKKFKISLSGGDTTFSSKLIITFVVLGYAKKNPVLRNTCLLNDDVYVTGDIGDAFLGLEIIKKRKDFGKLNNFFKKKYYEPNIPVNFSKYLPNIATSSIDISDGLGQDLNHLCEQSKHGANINLSYLPLSAFCKKLLYENKIKIDKFFSKGDDYQILFTSNKRNRSKIDGIAKKTKTKVSRIGTITKGNKLVFNYKTKKYNFNSSKMGYTHSF